ncbi:MAG: type I-F CRISPR-associated helicase Cas3f [Stenotrophomonas sp.]|uniref:type I-F CRISPR-associated helicase Cas3f n=1 Tax=Stenotrophomonas sp. TaxID=69392 RepID=UPI003D6C9B0B
MNILLVSQCGKRGLTETRRILDQFAERRGERTWQTAITQEGLSTLRRLLRKTARKNTAVACHWIRARDHSELLWVVGDARRFNADGATPTNTTTRNVLRAHDENDWHTAQPIRLLAQLAALLHDLGKASIAFQERLRGKRMGKNLYRHEWVSLRLFQAFVGDDDDATWLRRLADTEQCNAQDWIAPDRYQRDGLDAAHAYPFQKLPPLAAAVAWLVVTHHRLPVVPVHKDSDGTQEWLGKRATHWRALWLEQPLALVAHDWNEKRQPHNDAEAHPYWQPDAALPVIDKEWRNQAARAAKALLELQQRDTTHWLDNAYVMHLARLSLMLADHHYSSLSPDAVQRLKVATDSPLYANTHKDGALKQTLLEHLLGVARDAGMIAHALPGFERHLPRLANHRGLRKRSANPKFSWQDKAADAAVAMREDSQNRGGFIVNMASTGCGKTLANARILYAMSDPQRGMRATYALGLRTLTLQTGRSYRNDLHLDDDELAIRVGGSASRQLFDYYEQQAEVRGSASIQDLIEEDSHILYEGNTSDHPLLSRALHDPDIRNLIAAPMLVCTVDHMVPATESLRAGRQIAPMLRLMSADLVLDELDDYDLDDMPALTRLVHWAGMLGSRVVLSSATLPPSLVTGMYQAYRAGRRLYRRNRGEPGAANLDADIPCLWADEFGVLVADAGERGFMQQHLQFVEKRATQLRKAPPLRQAGLLPLLLKAPKKEQQHAEFAPHLRDACLKLHHAHCQSDPSSNKQVSFGLVRMANISPLFDVAQALFTHGAPEDTRIHLCVYHARFPLLQRSAIENLLDTNFNRRGDSNAVFQLPAIRNALDAHPERHQLFVVLASPVCEVGRDWDADWAVAEPSSMRSLIQLAGRVQRHRGRVPCAPNVLVFDTNLRHFAEGKHGHPAFLHPGYEKEGAGPKEKRLQLTSHQLTELLQETHYQTLTALPRIQPRPPQQWETQRNLVDLEQYRTWASMLPPPAKEGAELAALEREGAYAAWKYPQAALTGVLPQQQPFRENTLRTTTLVFLPDDDGEHLLLHRVEEAAARHAQPQRILIDQSQRHTVHLTMGPRINAWGQFDLMSLLEEQAAHTGDSLDYCAQRFTTVEVPDSDRGWRWHPLLGFGGKL